MSGRGTMFGTRPTSDEPFFSLAWAGNLDERQLALKLATNEAEWLLAFNKWYKQDSTQSFLRLANATHNHPRSSIRVILEYIGEKDSATYGQHQVLDSFREVMRAATDEELAYLVTAPFDTLLS